MTSRVRRLLDSWIAAAVAGLAFVALVTGATVYALAHHELAASGTPAPQSTRGRSASPSPTASHTASPTPSPVALGSPGRPATGSELAAMVAAGAAPAERDLGLGDWSTCAPTQRCLRIGEAAGVVGVDAGTVQGDRGCPSGCGTATCLIFLYLDETGWHYVNARCAQAPGSLPGPGDLVYVSGCANVRNRPGFQSLILDCLRNGTRVDVDSAPAYVDGRIWWHLLGLGWMAHDFLVAPASVP